MLGVLIYCMIHSLGWCNAFQCRL